ncbi:MAG: HAD family hydrolase [Alicyclobacillus sp.]|nr:HAD family hydrolase [Alicyclobacillus sp.]
MNACRSVEVNQVVEAVFFDLYETLITEWEQGEKVADFGSPGTALGLNEDTFRREWALRRDRRMTGEFSDYCAVLRDICAAHGINADEDVLRSLHDIRLRAKSIPFQRIRPDILGMLHALKRRGVKLGLISNCAPEEVEGLASSALGAAFDDMVLSFQVGLAKPCREIYQLACDRLDVDPVNSVFIGDGGSNELVGARQAGLHAYHAAWFQPDFISGRIRGFRKLARPDDVVEVVVK